MGQMDGYLPWANKAGKTALARAEAERAATAESARKLRLRAFALDLAGKARKGQITDGAGFVQVVDYAAGSVAQIEEVPGTVGLRAVVMMDDLKRVLIGDGFTNILVPTNPVIIGMLAMAGIPFDRWLRFVVPFMLKVWAVCAVALVVAVWVGYS